MPDAIHFKNRHFHPLWLRDNCLCADCRHSNGQRLHETWLLPLEPQVIEAHEDETGLYVTWGAESGTHPSFYPAEWLEKHAHPEQGLRAASSAPVLWGSELQGELPSFSYQDVIQNPAVKRDWLSAVARFGAAKLADVPVQRGMILKVVELFGFVRNTNYGELFEVVTEKQPVNLAYTPIPLSLHTDNPYRDPVPTLQLLHCLVQAQEGGVTALSDGFFAAEKLREIDPAAFALLSSTAVDFRFASDDAELSHRGPMIKTDVDGRVCEVRINNRSCAPIALPFEQLSAYYAAYQKFMQTLQGEQCKITLKLKAGELLLFDNQRVLHGREVQAIGQRHLQGCYADKDGLRSTLALLERQLAE